MFGNKILSLQHSLEPKAVGGLRASNSDKNYYRREQLTTDLMLLHNLSTINKHGSISLSINNDERFFVVVFLIRASVIFPFYIA